MLDTVKVPEQFEPLFLAAQECVKKYFQERSENHSEGSIEIAGQRYILVRGASLSVDLFEIMMERYRDAGREEAINVARSFLFDIAHKTLPEISAGNQVFLAAEFEQIQGDNRRDKGQQKQGQGG